MMIRWWKRFLTVLKQGQVSLFIFSWKCYVTGYCLIFSAMRRNANDRFLEWNWLIACDVFIFQEGSEALFLTLGIAAATGLGLLAFSEVGLLRFRDSAFHYRLWIVQVLCNFLAKYRFSCFSPMFVGRNNTPTYRLSCTSSSYQQEAPFCRGSLI